MKNNKSIEPLELLQIFNTYLNLKQATTDEILKELEKQDDIYFEQILKTLKSIEDRLVIIEEKLNDHS